MEKVIALFMQKKNGEIKKQRGVMFSLTAGRPFEKTVKNITTGALSVRMGTFKETKANGESVHHKNAIMAIYPEERREIYWVE